QVRRVRQVGVNAAICDLPDLTDPSGTRSALRGPYEVLCCPGCRVGRRIRPVRRRNTAAAPGSPPAHPQQNPPPQTPPPPLGPHPHAPPPPPVPPHPPPKRPAAKKPPEPPPLPCGDYVAFQVLLDRQGFSTGQIDGKPGTNFSHTLSALQTARAIPSTGEP